MEHQQGIQKIKTGAFTTLNASNLVDPIDSDNYNNIQGDILKAQGLVMCFSVFWARLFEVGNFKLPTKNRWLYYGSSVFIPSIFHAIYCSYQLNDFSNKMDEKYTQTYYEQYLGKIKPAEK